MQVFIDLVQRHEQAFYTFVHKVHSKGEGLFDKLINWMQLFLTTMRDGLGEPVNLEYVLPHTGQARADILKEVDTFALYHYKLKLAYESKVRRRFGDGQDGDAEDEQATQAVFDRVMGDMTFGELMRGDVDDIAAEESTDEESSEEETSEESDEEGASRVPANRVPHSREHLPKSASASQTSLRRSISDRHPLSPTPSGSFSPPANGRPSGSRSSSGNTEKPLASPPPGRNSHSNASSSRLPLKKPQLPKRKKHGHTQIKPPQLKLLPELLPLFIELVRASTLVFWPVSNSIRFPFQVRPLLKPRAV